MRVDAQVAKILTSGDEEGMKLLLTTWLGRGRWPKDESTSRTAHTRTQTTKCLGRMKRGRAFHRRKPRRSWQTTTTILFYTSLFPSWSWWRCIHTRSSLTTSRSQQPEQNGLNFIHTPCPNEPPTAARRLDQYFPLAVETSTKKNSSPG